jgi:hypothetical protein
MFTMPNLLKVALGVGVVSALYFFMKKYWSKRKGAQAAAASDDDYGDYSSLRPAFGHADDFVPTSPLITAAAPVSTSPVRVAAAPAVPAAAAAPAAAPAAEGTTSAAILGEDLLAKVNNLPPI